MAIDAAEVLRIARLAHLELPASDEERLHDDEELARIAGELERILDHVRDLSSVDVEGVPPTAHGVPLPTHPRPDAPEAPLAPERALAAAPDRDGDAFRVPKVVE
jgi:aspartyl-tRNA(Asn)/glutamyl-tRNA(Gln) amidotransferase subunit C